MQRDDKGYGLTVTGDNPVYVQSVKEGNYICCTVLKWFLNSLPYGSKLPTFFWIVDWCAHAAESK